MPDRIGKYLTLCQVANELSKRLTRIFVHDEPGRRAVFGDNEKLQTDPHFGDNLLFHAYFHGDNGSGVGASHQTVWTGLIAKLLQPRKEEMPDERCRRIAGRERRPLARV
jgi:hypothetical protein